MTSTKKPPSRRPDVLAREADFWTNLRTGGFARVRPWINRAIGEFSRDDEIFLFADPRGKDVLDYGCGWGDLAIRLARQGATRVIGIDIAPGQIAAAQENAEQAGVADRTEFLVADAHATGFPDDSFDLIIAVAVLHHLDLEDSLTEIRRILRPGGQALFLEPLKKNPLLRLGRKLTPSARTPDEEPLTPADWELCERIFADFRHREHEFLTIPFMPLNLILPAFARRALARILLPFDRAILRRVPAVRPYARTTLLILE